MKVMTPLVAQRLIAVPFLVLGAWCLFLPELVERLGVRAEYYHGSPTTALFIGCFGAQAILSGLFAAFSRFTKTTFLVYGIALLPFFWFNYWFVFVEPFQRMDGARLRVERGDAVLVCRRLCAESRFGACVITVH